MKVLYVSSEALPFMASGGLADVSGSLPLALRQRLIGCRVVMPYYGSMSQEMKDRLTFVTSFSVPVAWRRQYCGVFRTNVNGVVYYLLDNQYYFKREEIYGHFDDAERFAFFSRAVLELIQHIDFVPDIIHCNDWQSALTPVYHSLMYAKDPLYQNIKTIFTIHNIQYQGTYGMEIVNEVLGIPLGDECVVEYNGDINLMKGAIETANRVTTVSPTYAREILDSWYSHGLDGILRERLWKLSGILNGIDIKNYDPETDENIYANYSAKDSANKAVNKAKLQKELGLPVRPNVPIVAMVTRLVDHKGLDLVKAVLDDLLYSHDVQFVLLGSGSLEYEEFMHRVKERHADKVSVTIGFIPELSRKIYAGSDLFLMPSKSEPCGLSQMISLRYGTVPIVRETGGLKDSITDSGDGEGNGFTFQSYNAQDMLYAIERSLAAYANKKERMTLVARALEEDFSWGKSAREYIKLYNEVLKEE